MSLGGMPYPLQQLPSCPGKCPWAGAGQLGGGGREEGSGLGSAHCRQQAGRQLLGGRSRGREGRAPQPCPGLSPSTWQHCPPFSSLLHKVNLPSHHPGARGDPGKATLSHIGVTVNRTWGKF